MEISDERSTNFVEIDDKEEVEVGLMEELS